MMLAAADLEINVQNNCMICGGSLTMKKLKYFCTQCGQLAETCCDGGTQAGCNSDRLARSA